MRGDSDNVFLVPAGSRHVEFGYRQVGADAPGLAIGKSPAFEGLGAGDFMKQMPVDVQQTGTVFMLIDHMGIPELVIQCLGHDFSRLIIKTNRYETIMPATETGTRRLFILV